MDNPHTQGKYATKTECILAREAWFIERIKKLEKAVEFAGYMATRAERYATACGAHDEAVESDIEEVIAAAEEDCREANRGLRSAIYEFKKRVPV